MEELTALHHRSPRSSATLYVVMKSFDFVTQVILRMVGIKKLRSTKNVHAWKHAAALIVEEYMHACHIQSSREVRMRQP